MPIKQIDYNALGQSIDTSWGRSSTPLTSTMSVKTSILNDTTLKVNYMTIVNFMNQRELTELKTRYGSDATQVIKAVLTNIRASYKKLTGQTLVLKEVNLENNQDNLEIIGLGVHNPKRKAYYRRTSYYEMS